MVEHHPEAFAGAGLMLNEGGDGSETGGPQQFGIEITQKVPAWLKLVSTVHGNNERLAVENVRRGTVMLLEILQAVTR